MAGSLTITGIALVIQEMVASWTSMMVSHRSIEADLVDLLRNGGHIHCYWKHRYTVRDVRRFVSGGCSPSKIP